MNRRNITRKVSKLKRLMLQRNELQEQITVIEQSLTELDPDIFGPEIERYNTSRNDIEREIHQRNRQITHARNVIVRYEDVPFTSVLPDGSTLFFEYALGFPMLIEPHNISQVYERINTLWERTVQLNPDVATQGPSVSIKLLLSNADGTIIKSMTTNPSTLHNDLSMQSRRHVEDATNPYMVFLSFVQFFVMMRPTEGGCHPGKNWLKLKLVVSLNETFIYVSPPTQVCCFTACLMKHLGQPAFVKKFHQRHKLAIGMTDCKEQGQNICEKLGIDSCIVFDGVLKPNRAPKATIDNSYGVIWSFGTINENTPRLVLQGQHFILFREHSMAEQCENCYRYFKQLEQHQKKCSSVSKAKFIQRRFAKNKRLMTDVKMDNTDLSGKRIYIHGNSRYWSIYDEGTNTRHNNISKEDMIGYCIDKRIKDRVFICYGGSKREFFYILQALNEKKRKSMPFYVNDTLYRLKWNGNTIWDPHLFLRCDFTKACQHWLDVPMKSSTGNKRNLDYLVALVQEIVKVCRNLTGANPIMYSTAAKLAYTYWKHTIRDTHRIDLMTSDMADFVQAYFAKVEKNGDEWMSLSQNYEECIGDQDYKIYADINSHYPASLVGVEAPVDVQVQYPVGQGIWIESAERCQQMFQQGFIGFYKIRWTPPHHNLNWPVLPRINNGLQFSATKGEGVQCSVDIQDALDCGYQVEFLDKALIWTKSSDDVFKAYVDPLHQLKVDAPSPSHRSFAKLMLNALPGKLNSKMNQSLSFKLCRKQQDWYKFIQKHRLVDISAHHDTRGKLDYILLAGTLLTTKQEPSYPNHLGAFFLAYSRRILLRYMKAIDSTLCSRPLYSYIDTDGFILRGVDWEALVEAGYVHKHKLGFLKNDCGDGIIIHEKLLAAKRYCLKLLHPDNTTSHKITCNGIPKDKVTFEQMMSVENEIIQWTTEKLQKDLSFKKVQHKSTINK